VRDQLAQAVHLTCRGHCRGRGYLTVARPGTGNGLVCRPASSRKPSQQRARNPMPSPTGMTHLLYGTSRSLRPLMVRTVAKATRSPRSGRRTARLLPISTPGMDPRSSQPMACTSTFPAIRWPKPATQSSAAAWKMSVPTMFAAAMGKISSMSRPKNVPLPTEVRPTKNTAGAPVRARADLAPPVELPVFMDRLRLQEGLREKAEAADDQRHADDLPLGRCETVAVLILEVGRNRDTEERHRRAPE